MNGNNATHQVDHWFVVLLCGTINTIVLVVVVVVGGGWCDTHWDMEWMAQHKQV